MFNEWATKLIYELPAKSERSEFYLYIKTRNKGQVPTLPFFFSFRRFHNCWAKVTIYAGLIISRFSSKESRVTAVSNRNTEEAEFQTAFFSVSTSLQENVLPPIRTYKLLEMFCFVQRSLTNVKSEIIT